MDTGIRSLLVYIWRSILQVSFAKETCSFIDPNGYKYMCMRGGGLGSSTIFKKFNETYAPS